MAKDKIKKKWYKRWWAIVLYIFIGFVTLVALIAEEPTEETKAPEVLEVSIAKLDSIFNKWGDLSDIQKENKYETEFKDRIIKTSIIADRVNKASLSSKYVVLQMSGLASCTAKAFFPNSEKDKLLNVNIGDSVIFTGKLVAYKYGLTSCLTFEDSKFIGVESEK